MKQFGGRVTRRLKDLYAKSPNWRDGAFQNLTRTTTMIDLQTIPKLLYKQLCEKAGRYPNQNLPVQSLDSSALLSADGRTGFIWYGHSAVLMRLQNKTLLIDPMFGPDSSPTAPFRTGRFSSGTLQTIDQLPPVDLVLITHDHYDHLTMRVSKSWRPRPVGILLHSVSAVTLFGGVYQRT
jgi:hypothetical protein